MFTQTEVVLSNYLAYRRAIATGRNGQPIKASSLMTDQNRIRGVLSIILGRVDVGKILLRAFQKDDPRVVRYAEYFDPGVLVAHIRDVYPINDSRRLKELRAKTIVLLRLVLDARSADLTKIDLALSRFPDSSCAELCLVHLKNGRSVTERLPAFDADPRVCPVRTLAAYLDATARAREERRELLQSGDPLGIPHNMGVSSTPTFDQDSSESEEVEESDDEDVSRVIDLEWNDNEPSSDALDESAPWDASSVDTSGVDDSDWVPSGVSTSRRVISSAGLSTEPHAARRSLAPEGGGGDRARQSGQVERSARQEPSLPLFLQLHRPFRPLSSDALARIAINLMKEAGIDTSIFKAHAIRGAVATKMLDTGELMSDVMRLGRWRSFNAFNEYYNRQSTKINVMNKLVATLPPTPLS